MTRVKLRFDRRVVLIALAAIAAGAALFFVLGREKPPEFQTAVVRTGDLEVSISASGKVQPKNYVDVGAQVSGQLESFIFDIGEQVERGELLAEIDETLAASRVEASSAQLKELQASYAQQEATLELSRANAERARMLRAADAISEAELQAATADLKVSTARLAQLTAQIERQESTLSGDLATLKFTKIYAPMSGTIVSQSAVVGQTLNANQTTPTILRIADLTVMTVEAEVSEADVLRIRAGQEAYFTTIGDMNRRWPTRVRQVLPQPEIVNDVVLYKVLLDVENEDELLKPEMTAQVFFVTGKADNAVLAPVAALRGAPRGRGEGRGRPEPDAQRSAGSGLMAARASQGGESGRGRERDPRFEAMRAARAERPDAQMRTVLVVENGKPEPRPVLVGLQSRADAEIIHGLEPGDIVVTGEAFAVPAGGPRGGPPGRGFAVRRGG